MLFGGWDETGEAVLLRSLFLFGLNSMSCHYGSGREGGGAGITRLFRNSRYDSQVYLKDLIIILLVNNVM